MAFIPEQMIEEVHKRPGLWKPDVTVDRLERLMLWKEVGAALFKDWDTINKATAYDRVLQLQKRWRSYKDAYNREIRRRKKNLPGLHRVYIYFEKLSFLGGFEGIPEPCGPKDLDSVFSEFDIGDNQVQNEDAGDHFQDEDREEGEDFQPEAADPLIPKVKVKRERKKLKYAKRQRPPSIEDYDHLEQVDVSTFQLQMDTSAASTSVTDDDGDRLFLMSFVPEIKKLHPNIKMWVRAQIANVMQEAVTAHFNNTMPSSSNLGYEGPSKVNIKRRNASSSD